MQLFPRVKDADNDLPETSAGVNNTLSAPTLAHQMKPNVTTTTTTPIPPELTWFCVCVWVGAIYKK